MLARLGIIPTHARHAAILLAILLAFLLGSLDAIAGEVPWLLSRRSDDELVALVRSLDETPAPRVDAAMPAAAECLTHERILQLERNRYRITENAIYRVIDAEESSAATRHFQFPARSRIEEAGAWLLRDGKVTRCAKNDITVLKGDGSRPTEVIIAIPDVRDGDVVGWSFRRTENRIYPGISISLPESVPTRVSSVRLLTDGLVAYRILGRNLTPGTFGVEVLERRNGTETHTLATFRDLIAQADGPFAPPVWTSAPAISITWKGTLDTSIGQWIFTASWSEAAVWMESQLEDLTQTDRALEQMARDLVAGKDGPRAQLAALHDFVRKEIVPVDDGEMRAEDRPACEVLASRTATRIEAGALLLALAGAAGLDVRPVFARSQDLGLIDDGNPGFQQFSDLLVESLDEPGTYCAPARREFPLGTVPDDLLGATAMVLAPDLAAKERAVVEEIFSSVDTDVGRLIRIYNDQVSRLPWQTMFKLPGNPATLQGVLSESVSGTAGQDTLNLTITSRGRTNVQAFAAKDSDPAGLITDYCEAIFPTAAVLRTQPAGNEGAWQGVLRVDLGQPAGDTWLVPSESVFGAAFLDGWEGPDSGPFHVDVTREIKRIWRVRLPDGWRLASVPAPLSVTHPRFTATARMGCFSGELMVVREVKLLRGTTLRDDLAALAEAVGQVRLFEQTPVLLVRTVADASAR